MKYDFLIFSSLPKNSGCYLRALYLARSLEQNGARIRFVVPFSGKPFMLDFLLNFLKYFFYGLFTQYRIGVAVKPYPHSLLPLLLKKFLTGCRVIVDVDDIDFGYRRGFLSTVFRFLQKGLPRRTDLVTYHNPLLKNFIIREYGVKKTRLRVLEQGVDFSVFHPSRPKPAEKEAFLKKHGLKKNTCLLVYAAHLNIAADLDVILSSIRPVLEKNAFLIVAGGGPLQGYYQALSRKTGVTNIYFTGYLPPSRIARYVRLADYALVYYKERTVNRFRCSMKMRECLALKKKVICNSFGELKLFRRFTYQSAAGIAGYIELIRKLAARPPRDRREEKGYAYVKRHCDWKKIGGQFLGFVKSAY